MAVLLPKIALGGRSTLPRKVYHGTGQGWDLSLFRLLRGWAEGLVLDRYGWRVWSSPTDHNI